MWFEACTTLTRRAIMVHSLPAVLSALCVATPTTHTINAARMTLNESDQPSEVGTSPRLPPTERTRVQFSKTGQGITDAWIRTNVNWLLEWVAGVCPAPTAGEDRRPIVAGREAAALYPRDDSR